MPPNTVKVDRSTRWGNPFKMHGDGYPMDAGTSVRLFQALIEKQGGYVTTRPGARGQTHNTVEDIRRELRGRNLACWCGPDSPCHADVLLRVANPGGG